MKLYLLNFLAVFIFISSSLFAANEFLIDKIRLSSFVNASQLEEAFISNEFYSYLGKRKFEITKKKSNSILDDFDLLVEEINQVKRQETKELNAALSKKDKEQLPLLPLPDEPKSILSLEAANKTIQNELSVLYKEENKLKTNLEKIGQSQDVLAFKYAKNIKEITEIKDEINLIEEFLNLHLQEDTITNKELISYLENYVPRQGSISLLAELYKKKILRILDNKKAVIEGGRYGFENVPQGTSFILWDIEEQQTYDFDKFSAEEFKLPVFKVINVDSALEDNVELLEQSYTFSNLPKESSWAVKTENNFTKCLSHKSFNKARAVAEICRNLFPEEAYLNIDFDNKYLAYDSQAFILSISAAKELSNLLSAFIDEAKILLDDQFPKSFIRPSKTFLAKRLEEKGTDLKDAEAEADKVIQELDDGEINLNKISNNLIDVEKSVKDLKVQFGTNASLIQDARKKFEKKFKEADLTNKGLQKNKSKELESLIEKIKKVELEIESRFLTRTKSFKDKRKETRSELAQISFALERIETEQAKLETRLFEFYKDQHIKNNLSTEFTIKNPQYGTWFKNVCFRFKLAGDLFMTPPTQINLKYKGFDVPPAVQLHFVGSLNFFDDFKPSFNNKYKERVYGIAPSQKKKYTNIFNCHDAMKEATGVVARFFEAKGKDYLVAKNWSLEAKGVELGSEDDLLKNDSGMWGARYTQKASSNAELFADRVAELRKEGLSKFQLASQLANRLINFKEKDDAIVVQRILKSAGFYSGSIDGQWGPGSNAAMKKFMEEKGYIFEDEDSWSMELQAELLKF